MFSFCNWRHERLYKKALRKAHPNHKIIDITWEDLARDHENVRPIICKNDIEKAKVVMFLAENGFGDVADGMSAIGKRDEMVVKYRTILGSFSMSFCIKESGLCVWYRIIPDLSEIKVDDLI